MRDILNFDNGLRWVLIETLAEALAGNKLVGMGLSGGFDIDAREGYESRYYVLTDPKGETGHVMVRDANVPIMFTAQDGKLVWGNHFSHPWPEFEDEIAALSGHLKTDLGPQHCPTEPKPAALKI